MKYEKCNYLNIFISNALATDFRGVNWKKEGKCTLFPSLHIILSKRLFPTKLCFPQTEFGKVYYKLHQV